MTQFFRPLCLSCYFPFAYLRNESPNRAVTIFIGTRQLIRTRVRELAHAALLFEQRDNKLGSAYTISQRFPSKIAVGLIYGLLPTYSIYFLLWLYISLVLSLDSAVRLLFLWVLHDTTLTKLRMCSGFEICKTYSNKNWKLQYRSKAYPPELFQIAWSNP